MAGVLPILGVGVFGWARTAGPVAIEVRADRRALAPGTTLTIIADEPVRGATSLHVELLQGERATTIAKLARPAVPVLEVDGLARPLTATITLGADQLAGLVDGSAKVRVSADRAGVWGLAAASAMRRFDVPVDTTGPELEITRPVTRAVQGGAAVVVYRVDAEAAKHGVRVGKHWFAGHATSEAKSGQRDAVCLFALPHDVAASDSFRLIATDDLGNTSQVAALGGFVSRAETTDIIGVDERFLEIVVPRIRGKIPSVGDGKSLIGDYVAINSELRARNVATLRKLGMASPNERRWLGKFERMTAKVFGRFADHRSYMYRGRLVDRQWHMGFDLASVKNDDVPAANDGTVVFAAYLGIYGNAVVLDHGFGLTTIYAHMSSIDVVPGDQVARGDTLGRTGATGLALGDHLHFEVQVRGVAVRPAQWWDARWVRDNIDAPFDAIGISSRARSRGTRAARRADGRRDR